MLNLGALDNRHIGWSTIIDNHPCVRYRTKIYARNVKNNIQIWNKIIHFFCKSGKILTGNAIVRSAHVLDIIVKMVYWLT
jgi:hypothetical protein